MFQLSIACEAFDAWPALAHLSQPHFPGCNTHPSFMSPCFRYCVHAVSSPVTCPMPQSMLSCDKGSTFVLLHVDIPFSQRHLLSRLSSPPPQPLNDLSTFAPSTNSTNVNTSLTPAHSKPNIHILALRPPCILSGSNVSPLAELLEGKPWHVFVSLVLRRVQCTKSP